MTDHLKPENKALVERVLGYGTARTYNRHEIDRLIDAARAQGPSTSGADEREEIARIIDHEGYWERLDSCNHALATVSMTDDQRCALTAVRDDELRGTASSLAKADAILARSGAPRAPVGETGEVTDLMLEAALKASVPGGSEVWCWLPQKDAWTPSETARDVMRCALTAALAAIPRPPLLDKPVEEAAYIEGYKAAWSGRGDHTGQRREYIDKLAGDAWRSRLAAAPSPPVAGETVLRAIQKGEADG